MYYKILPTLAESNIQRIYTIYCTYINRTCIVHAVVPLLLLFALVISGSSQITIFLASLVDFLSSHKGLMASKNIACNHILQQVKSRSQWP